MLRQGQVEVWNPLAFGPVGKGRANYAYDADPGSRILTGDSVAEALPDRGLLRLEASCHGLVDDGDSGRARAIVDVEYPAL